MAHKREQCHENKGQLSTTCSKSRGNTKAAKIEGTKQKSIGFLHKGPNKGPGDTKWDKDGHIGWKKSRAL